MLSPRTSPLLRSLLACAALTCAAEWSSLPLHGAGVDLKQRTISSSGQFVVFCSDASVRARIANFAEETKAKVLGLLGESSRRGAPPIVISLQRESTENAGRSPVQFGIFQSEGSFKIDIDVRIGANPSAVNLQHHLVHALLLEYAYRAKPDAIQGGAAYTDVPWWLVEGAIQIFRSQDRGLDVDFFKRMIEANRMPPIEKFLASQPEPFGKAARAIDQACAMCLVQLLVEQPQGRENLARFLRRLPEGLMNPVVALAREFPALSDEKSLQRWWTLNLARFSAVDRYKGLSPEETDAQLTSLLNFEIPTNDAGDKRPFSLGQFEEFLKLPGSRAVLASGHAAVLALSTQANALYRPVVAEYEQIFSLLIRSKKGGVKDRIAKVEQYRESVLRRTMDIADYLNWFEATQMATQSNAFEGYLQAANEIETTVRRSDPISTYLDDIAKEL